MSSHDLNDTVLQLAIPIGQVDLSFSFYHYYYFSCTLMYDYYIKFKHKTRNPQAIASNKPCDAAIKFK